MPHFKLINNLGDEKTIIADNLDDAEIKANKVFKKWVDIIEIRKIKNE